MADASARAQTRLERFVSQFLPSSPRTGFRWSLFYFSFENICTNLVLLFVRLDSGSLQQSNVRFDKSENCSRPPPRYRQSGARLRRQTSVTLFVVYLVASGSIVFLCCFDQTRQLQTSERLASCERVAAGHLGAARQGQAAQSGFPFHSGNQIECCFSV